jgi:hypothetical protein
MLDGESKKKKKAPKTKAVDTTNECNSLLI